MLLRKTKVSQFGRRQRLFFNFSKLFVQNFPPPSCSSSLTCPPRSSLKLEAESAMSGKKRKATSAAKEPGAKQQKLVPGTEGKKSGGWLLEAVKQQRTENTGMSFNKKRLRFLSDAEKVKQGSAGVLYWMLRDHRVQGGTMEGRVLAPVLS